MTEVGRSRLRRLIGYFGLVLATAVLYVLLDFSFDWRPPRVQSSYHFSLDEIPPDRPRILHQDSLAILVIRRSAETVARLEQGGGGLQDPLSRDSNQPAYAGNALRSRDPEWFVSYAVGTDLGCSLEDATGELREICGNARYDFAGRALDGARKFRNLPIPDYNFAADFSSLTIRP